MFKLTCGYCLKQYKLQPWQQVHRKGDQLICPDCLAEWQKCFPTQTQPVQGLLFKESQP